MLSVFLGLLALVISTARGFAVIGTQGGVDGNTGFRPMRIDINQFKLAGPAWDLYIQALQQFLATNQSGQFSYYQIAGKFSMSWSQSSLTIPLVGIHGYPNTAWDGVTGNGGGVGFCTHGSILFPVWHRPYLALFEVRKRQSVAAAELKPSRTFCGIMPKALQLDIPRANEEGTNKRQSRCAFLIGIGRRIVRCRTW